MTSHFMATAALAACMVVGGQADAQWAVFDSSNFANTLKTMQTTANELTVLNNQLSQLRQTYQQISAMQTMFTNPTNITGMLPGLNAPVLQNPMPPTTAIPGQIGGSSTALSGSAQQFYTMNHVFTPTGTDAVATLLSKTAISIANIQGMAQTNLQSIEQRQSNLTAMEAELQGATDIKQVEAINGRIAIEANAIQGQQAQATNLQALANAQSQSTIQTAQEATRQAHEQAAAQFTSTLN
jgi:hypothetical protein